MPRYNPYSRRRSRFSGSSSQGTAAPPPVASFAPTVNSDELMEAYGWGTLNVCLGLRKAVEWYDRTTPALVFGNPLTADQQKSYDKALKAIALGNSTESVGERETAWTTAIRVFERIWASRSLPTYNFAMTPPAPPDAVTVRSILDLLNGAYGNCGARFSLADGKSRDIEKGVVQIPLDELKAMVFSSPIQTVLKEASAAATATSIATVDGRDQLDGSLFMQRLPFVLSEAANWVVSKSRDKSLTAPMVKPSKASRAKAAPGVPGVPVTPRVPSGPRRAPISSSMVIHLLSGYRGLRYHGQNAKRLAEMTEGRTAGAYRSACAAAGLDAHGAAMFFLKNVRDLGAIAVS